jgi:hypothetical protein
MADAETVLETAEPPVVEPVAEPENDTKEGDDDTNEQDGLTDEKKGRNRSFQGRIDDLTAKLRQTERERDIFKGLADPIPAQDSPDGAKPLREDFDNEDEFFEALTDWKVDQKFSQTAENRKAAAVEASFAERQAKVEAELPDYADVVGKSEAQVAPHLGQAILESEHGPKLAYHLAQNPAVLDKLNGMSPVQALMELGLLGSRLAQPSSREPTKAPPPVSPLKGTDTLHVDLAKAGMDEYIETRRKQGANF